MPPPIKREKLDFVPAGKPEFLKGAEDPARFVPNQQTGKPRSAPEIHSAREEIKNFPFFCMKTPLSPNTAQPSETTTSVPMEYPNSFVEYPSSFVEYPNSFVGMFLLGHLSLESTGDARGKQLRPCWEAKPLQLSRRDLVGRVGVFFSPQIPRKIKSFSFPLLDNSCSFLSGPGLNYPVPSS